MNYKYLFSVYILLNIFCINFVYAEALKDPRTRDETISNTTITSTVKKRSDGMYEYIYDIESSSTNKGVIGGFVIDVSCDLDFGEVVFSDPKDPYFEKVLSKDGKYIPLQAYGVFAVTSDSGISRKNNLYFNMDFGPGRIAKGLKIVSPAPPGMRSYELRPYMEPDGWDYASYSEDDPTVPWIDDFRVTGVIQAPACTFEVPSTEDDRFHGTGKEPFGINKLLTYDTPEKDPINVSSSNEAIQFHIYYRDNIDKARFKAKLNGKNISHLFKPTPGTDETVTISGEWKNRLNKLILSVPGIVDGRVKGKSAEVRSDKSLNTPANVNAAIKFDEFKSKDNDVFHIWFNQ